VNINGLKIFIKGILNVDTKVRIITVANENSIAVIELSNNVDSMIESDATVSMLSVPNE
jgi:hypothetical protein